MTTIGWGRGVMWIVLTAWVLLAPACTMGQGEAVGRAMDNGAVAVGFAGDAGASVVMLRDTKRGVDWSARGGDRPDLWMLVLGRPDRSHVRVTSSDAGRVEQTSDEKGLLRFVFSDIRPRVKDKPGKPLPVTVTCTVRLDGDRIVWGLAVANRSKDHAVWAVRYPRLPFATPSGKASEDDRLALPMGDGLLAPDPVRAEFGMTGQHNLHTLPGRPECYLDHLDRRDGLLFNGTYPRGGRMTMQFWAYTSPKGVLYCATEDGEARMKDVRIDRDGETGRFLAEFVHFPERMTTPGDYTVPYPVVTAPIPGDWYDACVRYRRWALDQYWTKSSRKKRGVQPEWFTDLGHYFHLTFVNAENVNSQIEAYLGPFDTPGLAYFRRVFDDVYDPPRSRIAKDGLASIVAMEKRGAYVSPYLNPHAWWLRGADAWSRGYAAARLTPGGAMRMERWGMKALQRQAAAALPEWLEPPRVGALFIVMCPGAADFRELFVKTAAGAVNEYKLSAIYLDQLARGETPLCFNKTHGHPMGGGGWMNREKRALVAAIRAASSETLVVTCEGAEEGLIGEVDAFLTVNSRIRQQWGAPLFQTVYNEYADSFAFFVYPDDLTRHDGLGFRTKFAVQTSMGETPGEMMTARVQNLLVTDRYARDFKWLQTLVAFRHANRRFFQRGRRLRDPRVVRPGAMKVEWAIAKSGQGHRIKTMPPVVASRWRAPDGTTALALINPTLEPQQVTLHIVDDPDGEPRQVRVTVEAGDCLMVEGE